MPNMQLTVQKKHPEASATQADAQGRWYGQPVVWLGVLILLASVAGCLAMICLGAQSERAAGSRGEDVTRGKVRTVSGQNQQTQPAQILGMPLKRAPDQGRH